LIDGGRERRINEEGETGSQGASRMKGEKEEVMDGWMARESGWKRSGKASLWRVKEI
jgi:hypothetical protein